MKSTTTAYLLWFFLGLLGIHKFYLGKSGIGFLYLISGGLLGIGWLIDLFTLSGQVDRYNALYNRPNNVTIIHNTTVTAAPPQTEVPTNVR